MKKTDVIGIPCTIDLDDVLATIIDGIDSGLYERHKAQWDKLAEEINYHQRAFDMDKEAGNGNATAD